MCGCMRRSVAGKIAADSSPFSVTFFFITKWQSVKLWLGVGVMGRNKALTLVSSSKLSSGPYSKGKAMQAFQLPVVIVSSSLIPQSWNTYMNYFSQANLSEIVHLYKILNLKY